MHYGLKETLEGNVVTVTFEKVDGTLREMRCTLLPEYLPKMLTEEGSETQVNRIRDPNILSVWDIDSGGWRSIRLDYIKQIVVG